MTNFEQTARTALKGLAASGDFLFNWHDCDPDNAAELQAYATALAAVTKATIALEEALNALAQEPAGQLMEEAYGRGQVLWFHKPHDLSMLYTLPPNKPWVGLTDEDIHALMNEFFYKGMQPSGRHFANFARAIEAKLQEKNAITDLEQAALAQKDPCPGCRKGGVCRTPACGRLKLPVDHPYRTGIYRTGIKS